MSRQFSRDYTTEVILGNVAGRSRVSVRGHDETVPNGGPFGLSPQFGGNSFQFDQSAISATPAVVSVASTDDTNDNVAGTGALTVRVIGLDASGDSQVETVTMGGQTEVATSNTFSAVFTLLVLTTGANNANTGTIYCGTGTFTAGVPAVRMLSMELGHNISLSGYFVVPNAKTLVLRQFVATVGSANQDVEVRIETSSNGILWFTQGPFGLATGILAFEIIALPTFAAGTHLRLRAAGGSAGTVVTAIIAGELIDD